MPLYCGIDLHSNNSVISIIDDSDRVIQEKRLDNDLNTIHAFLQPYQQDIEGVVVESTYNWYWLVDGLMDYGYPVHLANTLAIQQYNGIKHTNDQTDARYLAHLLRLGILPTGFIYPKTMRAIRDLLRRRLLLVRQKTAQLLSLQSTINRHTGIRLSSLKVKQLTPETLRDYLPDPSLYFCALQSHQLFNQLRQQVKKIEEYALIHYC